MPVAQVFSKPAAPVPAALVSAVSAHAHPMPSSSTDDTSTLISGPVDSTLSDASEERMEVGNQQTWPMLTTRVESLKPKTVGQKNFMLPPITIIDGSSFCKAWTKIMYWLSNDNICTGRSNDKLVTTEHNTLASKLWADFVFKSLYGEAVTLFPHCLQDFQGKGLEMLQCLRDMYDPCSNQKMFLTTMFNLFTNEQQPSKTLLIYLYHLSCILANMTQWNYSIPSLLQVMFHVHGEGTQDSGIIMLIWLISLGREINPSMSPHSKVW